LHHEANTGSSVTTSEQADSMGIQQLYGEAHREYRGLAFLDVV
jgi:hypothetical protein